MVPVNFVKLFSKIGEPFGKPLHEVMETQFTEADFASEARKCSLESLERCIGDIASIIPQSLTSHTRDLVTFFVRRDPLSFEKRFCPIFSPEGMLTTLKSCGVIKKTRLAILDVNDEFIFNGSRKPVVHTLATVASDSIAGGYIELTLKDGSVAVWTISKEELEEALLIWQDSYLGGMQYEYNYELILLLRAMKSLQSLLLFDDNEQLSILLGNIVSYYNSAFSYYEKERKKKFASSVDAKSRFISNQESEIEKLLGQLEDERDLAYGKRISHHQSDSLLQNEGQVISIGIAGW